MVKWAAPEAEGYSYGEEDPWVIYKTWEETFYIQDELEIIWKFIEFQKIVYIKRESFDEFRAKVNQLWNKIRFLDATQLKDCNF